MTGSIAPVEGQLLLGQSFLKRFKTWAIDNQRHALMLGSPQGLNATALAATYPPVDLHQDDARSMPAPEAWLRQNYFNCWTPPQTMPEGDVYVAQIKVILNRGGSLSA